MAPEQRLRAALFRGCGHLRRGEFFQAHRAFSHEAAEAEGEAAELLRGLAHLAAAGFKRQRGDERGCGRQLGQARRRLEPFLPAAHGIDLAELVALVES